jgi:hypothetical protein
MLDSSDEPAAMPEAARVATSSLNERGWATAWAASERTAWQYVTAMHAAAVGGPRAPIRGIVEDVEDMRVRLTRERDEARALAAELEKRLERRSSLVASLARQLSVRRRTRAVIAMVPWPGRPRARLPR